MKVVGLKMEQNTFNAIGIGRGKELTPSEWIRLLIEVMVAFPAESAAHRELREMVENERWGGRPFESKPGRFEQTFRVREDHWAALETMARAGGKSRMQYLRRLVFMGGVFKNAWYQHYLEERKEQ